MRGTTGPGTGPGLWALMLDAEATFDETLGLPSAVRAGLNESMSGVPYWGSDMTGFKCITTAPNDKEVFERWVEVGALSRYGTLGTFRTTTALPNARSLAGAPGFALPGNLPPGLAASNDFMTHETLKNATFANLTHFHGWHTEYELWARGVELER